LISVDNFGKEITWITAPPSAYELLLEYFDLNPFKRISASSALTHRFLNE